MEEGHLRKIDSQFLERNSTKDAIEILKTQVDLAEDVLDRKKAKNPLVRAAIKLVEKFLKKTGRICYGGQAINVHLPKELQFYDMTKEVPDYDVYTPNIKKDIRNIIEILRKAGFNNVSEREGMHEGTVKISFDYNDVLDLTHMDADIYTMLHERSKVIKGIRYADANFLRSNMYKELAQPEGEIDRWEKVYTRLVLLNEAVPSDKCTDNDNIIPSSTISKQKYLEILNFIINNQRVLAGAWIEKIYKKKTKNYSWILNPSTIPLIFYSPTMENDMEHLKTIVGSNIVIQFFEAHGDIVPACMCIYLDDTLIAIIVDEDACYSYNKISLQDGERELLITSLDTTIRLFYQLSLLRGFPSIAEVSIHCVAQNLVDISMKIRNGAIQSAFPLFSIECSGHQHTRSSLLRQKHLRAKLRRLTRKVSARQG
jgi:hypothetical protein